MAFNPGKEGDIKDLRKAIRWSDRQLEAHIRTRRTMVEEFTGHHWGAVESVVPANFLQLYLSIVLRQLAARNPQAHVTTKVPALKPFARTFELALNETINRIRLVDTLRKVLQEALISQSFAKVGLTHRKTVEDSGRSIHVSQPFADLVTVDQLIIDMSATSSRSRTFIGNRYEVSLEEVRESPLFGSAKRKVQPTHRRFQVGEGGEEKTASVGLFDDAQGMTLIETVELMDVFIPPRIFLTLEARGGDVPLRLLDWEGPSEGPYYQLSLMDVPDHVLHYPPAASVLDLHLFGNAMFNKIEAQARGQKTILGVQSTSQADGRKVIEARDGQAVSLENPQAASEIRLGGVDQANLLMLLQIRNFFNYFSGNIDILGGLGARSETFSQDSLLASNANRQLADMQDRFLDFTKRIITGLAHYVWNDQWEEMRLEKRFPKIGLGIPVTLSPEHREGSFEDFQFDVVPYSMEHQTPQLQLTRLLEVYQTIIAPALPIMAQQGTQFNFSRFFETIAELGGLDILKEMLTLQSGDVAPSSEMGNKPPITRRTYERVNRSGGEQNNPFDQLMQRMLPSAGATGQGETRN